MRKNIGQISDVDLNSRLNAVRASIRRQRKVRDRSEDSEISSEALEYNIAESEKELCWLEREHGLREETKTIHEEYMFRRRTEFEMARQQIEEEEKNLPDFDSRMFDNRIPYDCLINMKDYELKL